jgi:translocation and assembly module TamB
MRRHFRLLGHGFGTTTVFAAALTGGALLHLDRPLMHRIAVARTNLALAGVFEGKIRIAKVSGISATEVTGAEVDVLDPTGQRVVHAEGVHAKVDGWALVRSLLGDGDIQVSIPELSIANADVNLDADPSGKLRIAKAFTPRKSPETAPAAGRGVQVSLPEPTIGHATVHGTPRGSQPIDADVDGLVASVHVAPGKLALGLPRATITARGLPGGAIAKGAVVARYEQPSAKGGDRAADLSWRGAVGGIAESVRATLDGGAVDALVDVPAASPEQVVALWPASPLRAPAAVHLEARGTLPNLYAVARVTAGTGSVLVSGPVDVDHSPRASLHLDATAIDASAFAPAPATRVGASGDALLAVGNDGTFAGTIALDVPATQVAGVETPGFSLAADARKSTAGTEAHATLLVREPGAPTSIDFHLAPKGSSFTLSFDAATRGATLAAIRGVGKVARGSAAVDAHGTLDLDTQAVDANVAIAANDVGAGGAHVGTANVRARITGTLHAPSIDADAHAAALAFEGATFTSLDVKTHGPPTRPSLEVALVGKEGRLDGTTTLDLKDGTALRNTTVDLVGRGEHVTVSAALVGIAPAATHADDILITGLGEPLRGSVSTSPGALTIRAKTQGLELERLAHAAGIVRRVGGRVAFDVDAAMKWNAAQGHLALDLEDATVDEWDGAKAHVEATLEGRRLTGAVTASLGDIGWLEVRTKDAEIGGGGPLSPGWWRHLSGEASLKGKVDLAKLEEKLPAPPERGDSKNNSAAGAAPGRNKVTGVLDLEARVQRDSETDETPVVDLEASTHGLVVAAAGAKEPWRLEGVDATVKAHVDGETAHTSAEVALADGAGPLLDVNLGSDHVPYSRLLQSSDALLDIVADLPFTASFAVPERDIAALPSIVKTRGMHGALWAGGHFTGSLTQPNLSMTATLTRARTDVKLFALPLDVSVSAQYDGSHAKLAVGADGRSRHVLDAAVDVDARASDLLASATTGTVPPWKASASAKLDGFPLQTVGALDDHGIRGLASGQASIDGLHDDAKAKLALKLDNLKVGDMACKSAQAALSVDGTTLDATMGIDHGDGSVELRARAGSRWGSELAPSLDATRAANVSVLARHFRAEFLQPFLASVFAQLDGRIDAKAQLDVDPVARSARPQGTIDLSGGTFELASFGGEFHDVSAKLVATPDGIVKLEDASMRGLSGKVQAAATARLDGLSLVGARAEVQVPKNDPLPLVIDGVQAGLIDGKLALSVDRAPDRSSLDVGVNVPTLHVQLPTTSGHDVQALGEIDSVQVGVEHNGEFVPTRLDPEKDVVAKGGNTTPMKIAVKLGSDVQIARGSDLDARIDGSPTITIGNESRVSGQVRIVRGTLDVQGKPFTIENGTVSFVGDDASNPQVQLTAWWPAPDGTRIFADFIGPLRTAGVKLRSEPVLPQNQILSLILFGTVDAQAPTQGGTGMSAQGNTAAGAAGGAATGPLNKALGGVNKVLDNFGVVGGLMTKIDTSSSTPRPEVEIQIARDISVQVAWVLGVPPPGQNLDSTLFTLKWRFLRKFQLETTVGDAGTTIMDLVWQHRY